MTLVRKGLIIGNDPDLTEVLKEQLEAHGEFVADGVNSGVVAIEITSKRYYDIILIDDTLIDKHGSEVCKVIRNNGIKSPIIMLSASNDETEIVSSLDAGANDFIVKPFRIKVLMARIRARMRETEQSEFAMFQIGPYMFHPAEKLMSHSHSDEKVRLTEKETAIVKFLYLANENVVSRDTLLGEVWGYNVGVTTHTLETHVYRLRQKFEPDPSKATILVTEPTGYRLVR